MPAPHELQEEDLPVPFGRYSLLRVLGAGGMGRVFDAELRGPSGFRKAVALKVIRTPRGDEQELVEFQKEARLGGLLKHPNVVDVYDFGVTDGCPWIAMERIDGSSLDRLVASGPLPPTAALDATVQIAEGLAHAHGLVVDGAPVELVHRDLKPANVLVTPEGLAKVVDFGLARPGAEAGEMTAQGVVRGTPAYLSPEQARGETLDARSDLFALGLVLWELLTGERLLQRDNVIAVMMALVELDGRLADPAFLARAEAIAPGVGPVLARLLAGDRGLRFARASDAASALRAVLLSLPPGSSLRGVVSDPDSSHSDIADSPGYSWAAGTRTSGSAARRTNLAPDAGGFVGRRAELDALSAVARDARLVTVVGAGGTGKTRLARRYAASRVTELLAEGGVWFCDLTAATSSDGVVRAIAGDLGVALGKDDGGDRLADVFMARGPTLLLLDNAEQVAAELGALAARWLDRAPELCLIVTSRRPLRVRGETLVELGPLPPEDAAALFEKRAVEARPDLVVKEADRGVVLQLVERLDRIPLAIELAAARASVLPLRSIQERLDQRFRLLANRGEGRQATLRSTIQWSWDLLDGAEQTAMAQCAAFQGGFTVEAAEQVLDLSALPDAPWTLDVLQSLREQSLLRSWRPDGVEGEPRFSMFESVREFAEEELAQSGQRDAVYRRHGEALVDLGESLAAKIDGPRGAVFCRRLELEVDNLWAVVQRFPEADPELAVAAALPAAAALRNTGPAALARQILDRAVSISEDCGVPEILLEALVARAGHLRREGRLEPALADGDRALDLAQLTGNDRLQAEACFATAWIHVTGGDFFEAERIAGLAAAAAARSGDPFWRNRVEALQCQILGYQGQRAEARRRLELLLPRLREGGDLRYLATELNSLAVDDANAGSLEPALEHWRQALGLYRELGDRQGEGAVLGNMGLLAFQVGRIDEARRRVGKAIARYRDLGLFSYLGIFLCTQGCIDALAGQDDAAEAALREAYRHLRKLGSSWYFPMVCQDLSLHLLGCGKVDEAAALADEGLQQAERQVDKQFVLGLSAALAAARARQGDLPEARRLLDEAGRLAATADADDRAGLALAGAFIELLETGSGRSESRDRALHIWRRSGYVGADPEPAVKTSALQLFRHTLGRFLVECGVPASQLSAS